LNGRLRLHADRRRAACRLLHIYAHRRARRQRRGELEREDLVGNGDLGQRCRKVGWRRQYLAGQRLADLLGEHFHAEAHKPARRRRDGRGGVLSSLGLEGDLHVSGQAPLLRQEAGAAMMRGFGLTMVNS
jgi:hypothetical protein